MEQFTVRFLEHCKKHHLCCYIHNGSIPFIYMPIRKVAHTTCRAILNEALNNDRIYLNDGGGGYHYGHTLDEYLLLARQGKVDLSSHFKFMFVRNTYDRIISTYEFFHVKKNSRISTFPHFISYYVKRLDGLLSKPVSSRGLYKLGVHLNRQCKSFEFDNGERVVDGLYRVDDMNHGWESLRNELGIKVNIIPTYRNNIRRRQYSNFMDYYSPIELDIVSKVYARDLELFG